MAYVGISSKLLERVVDKIKSMERAELKTLGDQPKIVLAYDSPFVSNLLWGEHINLRTQTPDEWCSKVDRFDGRVVFKDSQGMIVSKVAVGVTLTGGEAKTTPKHSYYGSVYEIPETAFEIADTVKHMRSTMEVEARWKTVKDKVTGFLEECKSLNEAMKLWPDLRLYIRNDDLERLETKKEKSVRESYALDMLKDMDVDSLVGAAVIARMSEAA